DPIVQHNPSVNVQSINVQTIVMVCAPCTDNGVVPLGIVINGAVFVCFKAQISAQAYDPWPADIPDPSFVGHAKPRTLGGGPVIIITAAKTYSGGDDIGAYVKFLCHCHWGG